MVSCDPGLKCFKHTDPGVSGESRVCWESKEGWGARVEGAARAQTHRTAAVPRISTIPTLYPTRLIQNFGINKTIGLQIAVHF